MHPLTDLPKVTGYSCKNYSLLGAEIQQGKSVPCPQVLVGAWVEEGEK